MQVRLDENRVVNLLCEFLIAEGFEILEKRTTAVRGIDVVARREGRRLLVEAKGDTSSRAKSPRFDKGFSRNQVFDRVAKGVFTALQLRERFEADDVAVAFPRTTAFEEFVASVSSQLSRGRISVFWVSADGAVERI